MKHATILIFLFTLLFARTADAGLVLRNTVLWPGGVIPYAIDGTVPETVRRMIRDAVVAYDPTPVRFIERTTQSDYVVFSVRAGNASVSQIGKVGGAQSIGLLPTVKTWTIIHEMGHAAGLMHEHMRGDRNRYVDVRWNNLPYEAYPQFVSRPCDGLDVGAYDFQSIMHYGNREFAEMKLFPSLTSKINGVSVQSNQALSAGDIQTLTFLYRGGVRPPPTALGYDALLCGIRNDFAPSIAKTASLIVGHYRNVLRREPAPEEFASWLGYMLSGVSYFQAARGFTYSYEHSLRLFDGAYRRCLGRTVDPVVYRGQSLEQLLVDLVGSPEFLARPGRLVDKAYVCVLGRGADAYASRIANPTLLARALVTSPEYVAGRVRSFYVDYLRRYPGGGEEMPWVRMGGDLRDIEAYILTSVEYLARVGAY